MRAKAQIYVVTAQLISSLVFAIYTMRQKFSNSFNPNLFMIKYAHVFDVCFIGHV